MVAGPPSCIDTSGRRVNARQSDASWRCPASSRGLLEDVHPACGAEPDHVRESNRASDTGAHRPPRRRRRSRPRGGLTKSPGCDIRRGAPMRPLVWVRDVLTRGSAPPNDDEAARLLFGQLARGDRGPFRRSERPWTCVGGGGGIDPRPSGWRGATAGFPGRFTFTVQGMAAPFVWWCHTTGRCACSKNVYGAAVAGGSVSRSATSRSTLRRRRAAR